MNTDFGFSRVMSKSGKCSTLCGSLVYAAPEMLEVGSVYDGVKCDIWSIGNHFSFLLCL